MLSDLTIADKIARRAEATSVAASQPKRAADRGGAKRAEGEASEAKTAAQRQRRPRVRSANVRLRPCAVKAALPATFSRSSRPWSTRRPRARLDPRDQVRRLSAARAHRRRRRAPLHARRQRLVVAHAGPGRRRRFRDAGHRPTAGSTARSSSPAPTARPTSTRCRTRFDSARTESILYYVFDLPYYAGHDLRTVPLVERRAVLGGAARRAADRGRVRFSQDFDRAPNELLQNACRMRLEGMIGKRADSPYVSRRSPTWIKLKCTQRQEFVIGGWTDPQGSRSGIGSLLLGIHDEAGRLRFAGGVGSGFDQKTLAAVKQALAATKSPPRRRRSSRSRATCAATGSSRSSSPRSRSASGRPTAASATRSSTACATTRTRAIARAGGRRARSRPREAARTTKAPAVVKTPTAIRRSEGAAHDGGVEATRVEGIRISHPDRVIDTSTGITKLDVVNHYLAVSQADPAAPARAGRSRFVCAPEGVGGQLFFQKHAEAEKIPGLKRRSASYRSQTDAGGDTVHRAGSARADERHRVPHLERDRADTTSPTA